MKYNSILLSISMAVITIFMAVSPVKSAGEDIIAIHNITHGHGAHYDLTALGHIEKDSTIMVCNQQVKDYNTWTDTAHLRSLLSGYENIEVRIGESVYYEKALRDPDDPSVLKKNEFDRVVVFPNPVKDCLTIRKQQSDLQLSVFNTTGQLLMKRQLDGREGQVLDMDLLEPGIYVLQIKNNHYNTAEILIKE